MTTTMKMPAACVAALALAFTLGAAAGAQGLSYDILTTGTSLLETADAVRGAGAEPLAAAVIVDRSTQPLVAGFPIHALGRIKIDSWAADGCDLCARGLPLEKPGSSSAG